MNSENPENTENLENTKITYDPIFKSTYWGSSGYSNNEALCINRNNFKREFNIKCVRDDNYKTPFGLGYKRFKEEINPEYPSNFTFDHFELYEINDKQGFVAIFSPYHSIEEGDEYYEDIVRLGYQKYHSNLYSLPCDAWDCPTYYKVIPYRR